VARQVTVGDRLARVLLVEGTLEWRKATLHPSRKNLLAVSLTVLSAAPTNKLHSVNNLCSV
jgi:hypothetical protein